MGGMSHQHISGSYLFPALWAHFENKLNQVKMWEKQYYYWVSIYIVLFNHSIVSQYFLVIWCDINTNIPLNIIGVIIINILSIYYLSVLYGNIHQYSLIFYQWYYYNHQYTINIPLIIIGYYNQYFLNIPLRICFRFSTCPSLPSARHLRSEKPLASRLGQIAGWPREIRKASLVEMIWTLWF